MSRELRATYSVKAHLEPRAFAASVMLFDRPVFPFPEDSHVLGAPLHPPGPVEWTRNSKELQRRKARRLDPEGQQRLLDLLQLITRKVAWNNRHQKQRRVEAKAADTCRAIHLKRVFSSRIDCLTFPTEFPLVLANTRWLLPCCNLQQSQLLAVCAASLPPEPGRRGGTM